MKSLALLALGLTLGASLVKQTPTIQSRLTNVVLTTSQMTNEVDFYQKTLGFKPFYQDKTSCFLKTGSANLVFIKGPKPTKICLDVTVPDLPEAQKSLEAANKKLDSSDSQVLKLHDPDGNLIEVVKG